MKPRIIQIILLSVNILMMNIYAQTVQAISGKGVLKSFNSGITGKVFDEQTRLPIDGVSVKLQNSSGTAFTNSRGRFVIVTPPVNGSSVLLSSQQYLPTVRTGILFNNNIAVLDSILLKPYSETEFTVKQLEPNPNPIISKIETGGKVIRYYQVAGLSSNNPVNGIEVKFKKMGSQLEKTFISEAYNGLDGIVVIELDQETDIGCSECSVGFYLSSVNGIPQTNSPISIPIQVGPRKYSKSFELEDDIGAGLGVGLIKNASVKVGDKTTSKLILKELNGDSSTPDSIQIIQSFETRAGMEVGVAGGVKMSFGPVSGGVYGGISGGGYVSVLGNASYNYRYESSSDIVEKRTKMKNLVLTALTLSPIPLLDRLAFLLTLDSGQDYLGEISGGVGVKGVISGEAIAGLFTSRQIGLGLGANISGSAEHGGKLEYSYDKIGNNHFGSLTLFDKASVNAGVGFLSWQYANPGNPNFKKVNSIAAKSKLGLTLGIADWKRSFNVKYTASTPNPLIVFNTSASSNNWETRVNYSYSHPALGQLIGSSLLNSIISLGKHNTQFIKSGNITGDFIGRSSNNLLINIADKQISNGYPPINYTVDSIEVSKSGGFNIGIDWKIGINISFGLDYSWKTSNTAKRESGVLLGGLDFPLERYSTIPKINTSMSEVIKKIFIDGVNTFSLSDILTSICIFCGNKNTSPSGSHKENFTIISLSDNGSQLEIDLTSIPPGIDSLTCNTWSWYGNSSSSKSSQLNSEQRIVANVIKNQQQSLAKMDYGIGGFYKFQPQSVKLTTPAILTLVYDDEEVVGLDESSLAIFYQDTLENRWKFAGGLVDTLNNKITISIDSLELYTIAPIMPDGDIGLNSDTDTLTTENTSLANITSDTLKLSDGSNVGSGMLYTIIADNLQIEAEDEDLNIEGIQVASVNSIVNFHVKGTTQPGIGKVRLESVNGLSSGLLEIVVIDTIPPPNAVLDSITIFDEGVIIYLVNPDTNQVVQYEVHYDTKSGEPYMGIGAAGGEDSPFIIAVSDSIVIQNLLNDTTYYFAVKTIDRAGNRSGYSNEISGTPIDTIAPGAISEMDFTLMADSSWLVRWKASGDNGDEGRATKYYLKISNEEEIDTNTWWVNATGLSNVTSPSFSGSYDYHILSNVIDTSYRIGIQTEDEAGNQSTKTIFRVFENRGTKKISLSGGWNIISHPVKMQSIKSLKEILPNIEAGPYIYDKTSGYVRIDTLSEKQGCWVYVEEGYEMNINGMLIGDTTINVEEGWNIIGGLSREVVTERINSIPEGIVGSPFWGSNQSGYYSEDTIKTGKGYWIYANSNGQLILPISSNVIQPKIKNEEHERGFRVKDRKGGNKLLLLMNSEYEYYKAPPKNPGNTYEVRYVSGRYAEDEGNGEYEINVENGEYPIEVICVGLEDKYKVCGEKSGKEYGIMNVNEGVKVTDKKDNIIKLRRIEIPKEYYLANNYPNPFNPMTVIEYGLPVESKIDLIIYDVLGQQVEVLLKDTKQEAGKYKIEWNAGKFASGVYILRMKTNTFTSVKKMMLIK